MSMLNLYKSHLPSCSVIFPNGKSAVFVNGRYATDVEYEINIFDTEIKAGHSHIYKDPNELQVDSEQQDPMAILTAKIRAQVRQEMLEAQLPGRDFGNSDQTQKLNVANTSNIAEAAAGGSGSNAVSALAALRAQAVQAAETHVTPVTAVPAAPTK